MMSITESKKIVKILMEKVQIENHLVGDLIVNVSDVLKNVEILVNQMHAILTQVEQHINLLPEEESGEFKHAKP